MRLALAWLFLLAPALGQGVRTGVTPQEMEALLKAWSYRYERVEEKGEVYFRLRLAGLKAVLYLLDCQKGRCESLQLYAGFTMDDPPAWSGSTSGTRRGAFPGPTWTRTGTRSWRRTWTLRARWRTRP